MELDLGAVRAFVAVVDEAHFGAAAGELGVSQQAVSKRVAKLEGALGARLLEREPTRVVPTPAGREFLRHARAVLTAADRATTCLRPARPLRVDVLRTRLAPASLLRELHEQQPGLEIEVVTSDGLRSVVPALREGRIDAAFARPAPGMPATIRHRPAYLDRLTLGVGVGHALAGREHVRPSDLAGLTAWMPGNVAGSEWAEFYDELAREFGLTIDVRGPNFGIEYLLDELARDHDRVSFLGPRIQLPPHPGVRQVPIVDPVPVYPFALLWDDRHEHPSLPALRSHLDGVYVSTRPQRYWVPAADHAWLGAG